ncbi:MAG: Glycosyl transferase group 1 [Microgenomates group bacterium GW2011_GWC1_49_7]|nr:MAG: Glycosyl transferase group 1 [Microgenomates group bacterium GW2011_GWC1_49_7]
MKVAILSSLVGGLGHYCSHLAGPLSKLCQLKFITYPQTDLTGTVVNEITDGFVKEKIKWPRFDLLEDNPFSVVDVNSYLKQRQFQVINLHVGTTVKQKVMYFTSLLLYAKKINHFKTVFSLHDVLPFEEDKKLRKILKMFYGLADSFTVGNEKEAEKLTKYFGIADNKINIIHHGIYNLFDKNQFSQNLAKSYLNIPREKKVILFFGWLREYKGFENLIRAAYKLKKQEANFCVYVTSALKYASAGLVNKYLRLIKRLNLENEFILNFNYLDSRDIEPVFKAADIVALPYTKVSQSGVLMMAMGFKKPVVITDVFYERKWVSKRAGLMAEAGNNEDIAEKLKQLLQNKSLALEYGNEGYNYASLVFSWQKIAKQYYQAYKRLAP